MLPAELADFDAWPTVKAFVRTGVTPHFADIRGLLKKQGYNFITADGLCSIVSDLSTTMFQPTGIFKRKKEWWFSPGKGKPQRLGTNRLFKMVLETYYPWEAGENPQEKAKELYELIRCPFSHALGQDKLPGLTIYVRKGKMGPPEGAWNDAELTQIETDAVRPFGLPLAWVGAGTNFELRVESFYRGVFQLLRTLAKDAAQMKSAEARFKAGNYAWNM